MTRQFLPLSLIACLLSVVLFSGGMSHADTLYNQTIDSGIYIGTQFDSPSFTPFTFTATPVPITDGVLTVIASGDISDPEEDIEVWAEGFGPGGMLLGNLFALRRDWK